tara:strand:- start:73 stop:357 length:285 start_codon:yes stop_codon:yes gene_type:complete
MLPNQLISLLSFRAFTSGSRQDDISVNPANIQYITTDHQSLTNAGGTFYATVIHLTNTSIKVAQSIDFINYQVNRAGKYSEEYIQDTSQRSVAK